MKKLIRGTSSGLAAVIAMILIFSLSACSKGNDAETGSLYAQGLEIVQLMSEMTQSEECVKVLYSGDSNIRTIIRNIGIGDFSSPKAVYAVSIADDELAAMTIAMAGLDDLGNVSGQLRNCLMQRTLASLMTQINAMGGMEILAASSVCTVGKTFVDENVTENVIYLYVYENAIPVAVIFTIGEDQAVSASGIFIMYDGFTCSSADEIRSFFNNIDIAVDITVDVSEILPEK